MASDWALPLADEAEARDEGCSGAALEDKALGLPSPEAAQRLPVVVRRGVLSAGEIAELLAETSEHAGEFGSVSRDSLGVHQLLGPWTTQYIHTGGWFRERFPALYSRFAEIVEHVDAEHWHLMASAESAETLGKPVARTIEIHSVKPGGALPDVHHLDSGSLWTFDVMLAEPDKDFGGGTFGTLEPDERVLPHSFGCGDAVIFPSHKKHHVQPVSWGHRQVLVIEFWHGEERTCAHRCLQRWGACEYGIVTSRLERMLRAAPPPFEPVFG